MFFYLWGGNKNQWNSQSDPNKKDVYIFPGDYLIKSKSMNNTRKKLFANKLPSLKTKNKEKRQSKKERINNKCCPIRRAIIWKVKWMIALIALIFLGYWKYYSKGKKDYRNKKQMKILNQRN